MRPRCGRNFARRWPSGKESWSSRGAPESPKLRRGKRSCPGGLPSCGAKPISRRQSSRRFARGRRRATCRDGSSIGYGAVSSADEPLDPACRDRRMTMRHWITSFQLVDDDSKGKCVWPICEVPRRNSCANFKCPASSSTASAVSRGASAGMLWPTRGMVRRWYGPVKNLACAIGCLRRHGAGGLALQRDRRHGDRRLRGELFLDRRKRRIARHVAVAHPVRMDHHVDEIRIVERARARLERRIVERPVRRPQLPQAASRCRGGFRSSPRGRARCRSNTDTSSGAPARRRPVSPSPPRRACCSRRR